MARKSPAERFADKVDRNGPIPLVKGVRGNCHIWTGAKNPNGYGRFYVEGKLTGPHQFAYGPVPPGLEIDHRCNRRDCVRRSHLRATTHAENVLRSAAPTARNAAKTQCKNGHRFDDANTRVAPDGSRNCRTCARLGAARRRATQKPSAIYEKAA